MLHTTYANKFLELVAAKTASIGLSGTCYLGFSSTTPNANGSNFSEPTASCYERIQLCVASAIDYTDLWGEVANGALQNAKELTSREWTAEGGSPTFTHFGIFENKTGGTPIFSDPFRNPNGEIDPETGLYPETTLTIPEGDVAVIRAGMLQLTLN